MARIRAVSRAEPIYLYDLSLKTQELQLGNPTWALSTTPGSSTSPGAARVLPLTNGFLSNPTSTSPQYISNTFMVPGMDAIRFTMPQASYQYGSFGFILGMGARGVSPYGFNSPFPTLSHPTTYSGSVMAAGVGNIFFDYITYPTTGLLTNGDHVIKSYKAGQTYTSGYINVAHLQMFIRNQGRSTSSDRGSPILIRTRIAPPVLNFDIGISDRALKGTSGDARLGPTGNITATYSSGMFFECFTHSDYYADSAHSPSGKFYWSATDGEFWYAGAGNQNINLNAVQYFPPAVPSGQTKTITITCELRNHHGYTTSVSRVLTIVGASGGNWGSSTPGVNSPPALADHGLVIHAANQAIRFQADSTDAFARLVSNSSALSGSGNFDGTGSPGGLKNHSAAGCNSSNAFAISAASTTSSFSSFPDLDEVAPTLRFSGTGNLQSKGGYLQNDVTICRVRGPSLSASGYGLQVTDANDNVVLDDGELSLGVVESIRFEESTFASSGANLGTYSYVHIYFSNEYSVAPMIAFKTDKNLFAFRPTVSGDQILDSGPGGFFTRAAYRKATLIFPGNVRSGGTLLVMEPSNIRTALTYENENYGLLVQNELEEVVLDTRKRIATVTDVISAAGRFNTGTSAGVNDFNITTGFDGVDASKMNPTVHGSLPNQVASVSINGNPGLDYICMNGVTGRTVSTTDVNGQFRPAVRFAPSPTKGIQMTMGFAGEATILPNDSSSYNRHPEGQIIIIRSL